MAIRPPVFNLLASLWTCDGTAVPADGPADYTDVPVQKYIASRSSWPVSPPWANGFWLQYHPPVQLRFPRVPPFDVPWELWTVTCAEVPQGSGQYYRLFWNDIQHEGFPNEYALMVAVQCNDELLSISPAGSIDLVGVGEDPCGNLPPQDTIKPNISGGLNCCSTGAAPGSGFLATFSDTAGTALYLTTADSGQSWVNSDSSPVIGPSTGTAYEPTDGLGEQFGVAYGTGLVDGTIIYSFQTPSLLSGVPQFGVIFRVFSSADYYLFKYHDNAGPELVINLVSGGLTTPLASQPTVSLSDTTAYKLRVVIAGSSFTCTIETSGGSVLDTISAADGTIATADGIGMMWDVDTGATPPHVSVEVDQLEMA